MLQLNRFLCNLLQLCKNTCYLASVLLYESIGTSRITYLVKYELRSLVIEN
jgi:hypothetical protein